MYPAKADMPLRSQTLAASALFQDIDAAARLPHDERIQLTYKRLIAIGKAHGLTAADIMRTTPKFWALQLDPILSMDGGAATLIIIHLNLCTGTFARRAIGRPDLQHTLNKLLNFELIGQYCLTEQAHGLDARNIETTATLLADGSIDLHTPHDGAAKHMPPTSPCGIPTMAVVFARFIVNGEDRGVKEFMVMLHDGKSMSRGITSRLLAPRGGSVPVDHCLTYFDHVSLPLSALLSSPEKGDAREQFFESIYRVIVGSISIAGMAVTALKVAVLVAGRYSQRRKVTDAFTGKQRPIISFPTQQYPVFSALAQAIVFESLTKKAIKLFTDKSKSLGERHCIAAVAKVTHVKHCLASLTSLGDRCGAQGIFQVNQFSVLYSDVRGASIAEGDLLAISVRFAVELLIQRVALPDSTNPESLLARRVTSMFQEIRGVLSTRFKHHRDPGFQAYVLPLCQPLIEAIGYRMAYDAAVEDGVDKTILDMFVASIVREDRAWFSEVGRISRPEQMDLERNAMEALLPRLDDLLSALNIEEYCTAPIISDGKWRKYVQGLPTFASDAYSPAIQSPPQLNQFVPARAML